MDKIRQLFAQEEVNTGRQPEFDLLKSFLIIGMIFVHVFEDCFDTHSVLSDLIAEYLCCIIGAASFMFCMGVAMQYSRRVNSKNMALRGLSLLCVGQLLNLGRNVLPNLLAYWGSGGKWFLCQMMLVIQADILSFAALTFFLMAIFLALKLTPGQILGIGAVMNILSMLGYYYLPEPSGYLQKQLLGYFIVTSAESYFPLLSYFFFVAFGFYVGSKYRRIKDKDKACSYVFKILIPICVIYYTLRFLFPVSWLPAVTTDLQYNMQPFPDAIATSLVSIILLAVAYVIIRKWFHGVGPRPITSISRNINRYYCISYMFILPLQTLFIYTLGELPKLTIMPFIASILIVVFCAVIVQIYDRTLAAPIQNMKVGPKLGTYVLILAASAVVLIYVYPKLDVYPNIWNNYLIDNIIGKGDLLL